MSSRATLDFITEQKAAGNLRLALGEQEAAKALGVSTRTLFTLRAERKLGFVKLTEGKKSRVLYPMQSLEKFLADNTKFETPGASDSVPLADQKPAADAGTKPVRITE